MSVKITLQTILNKKELINYLKKIAILVLVYKHNKKAPES